MLRMLPLAVLALGGLVASRASAAPHRPTDDTTVVEQLPYALAADPVIARLREMRSKLAQRPDDLRLALLVARGYSELGRRTGDPRYSGQAQAALQPWWSRVDAPREVMLLRATLNQRAHRFDAARRDLDELLRLDPRNAQARLERATVRQVQGEFALARADCPLLAREAGELVAVACAAASDASAGHLRTSYLDLAAALEREPRADASMRAWVLNSLAEMAERAGLTDDAERHFRAALALDPADFYLLGAYADFLLERGRATEVINLLATNTRADPLLLRFALALHSAGSAQADRWRDQLQARFEASRMRGDRVHQREEAIFRLRLAGDAKGALRLARENWGVQKEPADLRILVESALAAGDAATLREALEWRAAHGFEDVRLDALLQRVRPGTPVPRPSANVALAPQH